jgi:hypothetical protein
MASNLVDDRIQKCWTTTGGRVSQMRQIGWWWHAVNSGGDPTTFKKEKPESFPEELPVAPAELQKIQHSHMTMCQTPDKLDW